MVEGFRVMGRLAEIGWLSLGGVIGVNARYWIGLMIVRWAGPPFPWATFVINVAGSFLIGLLTVALSRWLPHPHARLHLVTGLLGGFTTYSAFAFESLTLWESEAKGLALAYMTSTLVCGFAAVAVGVALGRWLTGNMV